jgi:di/tricarboxylate transporter
MKLKQLLITTAALLFSFQIAAQDLIYRNNGKIIEAKILNTANKSLTYKLYEQADSITYFISVAIIDSVVYRDGKKETFIKTIVPSIQQSSELISNYNHHLIGADLAGFLFYRNLIVSYEYLPGKAKIGFKAAFAKNLEPWYYYNDPYFFDGDYFFKKYFYQM